MITRIVKLQIASDSCDEWEALFQKVKPLIESVPGCHQVILLKSSNGIYFTYSQWDSEQALEDYRSSAFFGEVWPKIKALCNGPAQAWTTTQV